MSSELPKANPAPPPGEFIREELRKRSWSQQDLAQVLGRTVARVNQIIMGKQEVSPEVALSLESAFGIPAETWLQWEAAYRLALHRELAARSPAAGMPDGDIPRRVKLYEAAPIKEMQKRGWITTTDNLDEIERELLKFFGAASLDKSPSITASMKKSAPAEPLSSTQRAWCFRVKQMATALKVSAFEPGKLGQCERDLRRLAAYPQESRKVANTLSNYGIRFVVVEPLPGSKIDGAALWLDDQSPVIAVSLRFDRVDAFWFTVAHEFRHIANGDALSVDTDMVGAAQVPAATCDVEDRANREAAAMLVPPEQLESFILRVGPMYSEDRIVQFAHSVKVYPGIIVGQLQHRGEVGYQANRKWLVKVRDTVLSASITDGWGHTIDRRVFE